MAHSLGPITSASATACSKDSPCFLLQPRNQAYRRHGHDHAPPALFRAAASLQQNHRRTTHTAANRAICSRSQRHSVRSFLACPQRRGCQIDQIAIGRTRGPRFRATKVSATPPTFSARPQPRRGVAETSPFRERCSLQVVSIARDRTRVRQDRPIRTGRPPALFRWHRLNALTNRRPWRVKL